MQAWSPAYSDLMSEVGFLSPTLPPEGGQSSETPLAACPSDLLGGTVQGNLSGSLSIGGVRAVQPRGKSLCKSDPRVRKLQPVLVRPLLVVLGESSFWILKAWDSEIEESRAPLGSPVSTWQECRPLQEQRNEG